MNKTAQRDAILNELRAHNSHPTADKLYEVLRKKLPQISLGTVYRNLEQMASRGTIKKLSLAGHQKRFDGDLSRHYHIRCPHCDNISNIKVDSLIDLDDEFQEVIKKIGCDNYYFELISLCEDCKNKLLEEQKEAERIAQSKKREVLVWTN